MENLVFLVIVAALALGKWLFENAGNFGGGRDTPDDPSDEFPPPPRRRAATPVPRGPASPANEETEEERVKRFMEALGLPATGAPMPPRGPQPQRPPVPERRAPLSRPKPDVRHLGEPFGAPMSPPVLRRRPAMEPRREPVPQPGPRPVIPEPAPEPMSAPVSESAPAMEVASLPRIEADTGRAVANAAFGVQTTAQQLLQPFGAVQRPESEPLAVLKQQLRDPGALRRAILLREILGTPKGLQRPGAAFGFPNP